MALLQRPSARGIEARRAETDFGLGLREPGRLRRALNILGHAAHAFAVAG
jgi:hypothetical protein